MNIIIDDDLNNRQTPKSFTRFTTGNDLLAFMKKNPETIIEHITFDNDLGDGLPEGYDIVKTMVNDQWQVKEINLHSANIIAVRNMISYLQSALKADAFSYTRLRKEPLHVYTTRFD